MTDGVGEVMARVIAQRDRLASRMRIIRDQLAGHVDMWAKNEVAIIDAMLAELDKEKQS